MEIIKCHHCSIETPKHKTVEDHEGNSICTNCENNHYARCHDTGELFPLGTLHRAFQWINCTRTEIFTSTLEDYVITNRNELWAREWTHDAIDRRGNQVVISQEDRDDNYSNCNDCDALCHDVALRGVHFGDRSVCDACCDNYWYCEVCDTHHHEDYSCEEREENNNSSDLIESYRFKPVPKFYGGGNKLNPYIGFELEIENKTGSIDEQASYVNESLSEYLYMKEDSSLSSGFEIVSHPMTIHYHKTLKYKELLKELSRMGAKSHDTNTCGLHFHLDKRKMSDTHKTRFGIFFALQKNKLEVLARRTSEQYAKFKNKHLKDAKEYAQSESRYEAVNWENNDTVEVRIFKGTLKFETFMASMELCHAIYCFTASKQSFSSLSENQLWERFVKFVNKDNVNYSNLINYLNEKKELLEKAVRIDELEHEKHKLDLKILKVNSTMKLAEVENA